MEIVRQWTLHKDQGRLDCTDLDGATFHLDTLDIGIVRNVFELNRNLAGFPNPICIMVGSGNLQLENDSFNGGVMRYILQDTNRPTLYLATQVELDDRFIRHEMVDDEHLID